MKINISGKGVHRREIPGVERLRTLPAEWYAFTNLELIQPGAMPRQVDITIVLDDRILLVDLKDWHGKITSDGDRWFQNDRNVDTSPVKKILENARILKGLLAGYLAKLAAKAGTKFSGRDIPLIEGCVVLTARCDVTGIAEVEKPRVFHIDEFCRALQDRNERNRRFAPPPWIDRAEPLTAENSKWRSRLASFFGASTGYFRPLEKTYGAYRVVSDVTYAHPKLIYTEYDAEEVSASRSLGLLRLWDFSKADTLYAGEEARAEIAGREQHVIGYLIDRHPDLESVIIRPKVADSDKGIHYWEVFERRRQLKRLREFVKAHAADLSRVSRLDLARTLLSQVATIHRLKAAHLDIGAHSVWLELPAIVRLSHFVAAAYPEIRSLGHRRYEFLAAGIPLPEEVLGEFDHFRKDVFLLAVAVHTILFGQPPNQKAAAEPPDWSPAVDSNGHFLALQPWFAKGLDHAPDERFTNAQEMLDAFNELTRAEEGDSATWTRLQMFRKWRSILEVSRAFPIRDLLAETDRVLSWRSDAGAAHYLVKAWRRVNWEDERAEATRLLRFCERGEDFIVAQPRGLARMIDVGFVGDHLVLVQEFVDGPNLADDLAGNRSGWNERGAVCFIGEFARIVDGLHASGRAHGDISPRNVIVKTNGDDKIPILVDVLDFAPADEGEIHTSAYAPPGGGGAQQRDRFAVLTIADEIFGIAHLAEATSSLLRAAIHTCRDESPKLATLSPLLEAIEKVLSPRITETSRTLRLRIVGAATGPMTKDEGRYYVCVRSATWLTITGAFEDLSLTLGPDGSVLRGQRRQLKQTQVALAQLHAVTTLLDDIVIDSAATNDFSMLDDVLGQFRASLVQTTPGAAGTHDVPGPDEEDTETGLEEDAEVDVPAATLPTTPLDVQALWRTLMDVELEQFTEGVAESDSLYSRDHRRHFVTFSGRKGTIDFAREDKVVVELEHRRRGWLAVGVLDQDLSRDEILAIDASAYQAGDGSQLCRAGAEFRLRSLMEADSRARRDAATARILSRQSVIADLIDYFDVSVSRQPIAAQTPISAHAIRDRYKLNDSQVEAFISLWSKRPVGLLQGPPGTGKTRFIAAFAHHALTSGIARNVLLASQSHEAVNHAAESVLKLFRQDGQEPSLVRVGQEGNVSESLKPYHTEKVELRYREQFRAGLKQRFRIAGREIGLPDTFTDDLYFLEMTLWPVTDHLQALLLQRRSTATDADIQRRAGSLLETTRRLVGDLEVIGVSELDWSDPSAYEELIDKLAEHHGVPSREHVRRLRAVATLARDWMGTVSSRRRSFEEFLANTRQIVCGTCVGLGRTALGLASGRFDLVIVDEAARCTPSELAVPIQSGRWILLVGDHAQLEPFHEPAVLRETHARLGVPRREIARSDFERAFSSAYGRAVGATLLTQYRMLRPIGRVVSNVFYGRRLEHGRTERRIAVEQLPERFRSEVLWVRTDELKEQGFQSRGSSRTSLCNTAEANAIVDILRHLDQHQPFLDWLTTQPDSEKPIGIICTYAEQRELVRRRLNAVNLSRTLREACKIDTVDSYQGKENTIVLLSLVRNNVEGRAEAARPTIAQGYMARGNRINVAMSRAMDHLIIVGASERWPEGGPMARVSAAVAELVLEGTAQYIDATSLASEEATRGRRRHDRRQGSGEQPEMRS